MEGQVPGGEGEEAQAAGRAQASIARGAGDDAWHTKVQRSERQLSHVPIDALPMRWFSQFTINLHCPYPDTALALQVQTCKLSSWLITLCPYPLTAGGVHGQAPQGHDGLHETTGIHLAFLLFLSSAHLLFTSSSPPLLYLLLSSSSDLYLLDASLPPRLFTS